MRSPPHTQQIADELIRVGFFNKRSEEGVKQTGNAVHSADLTADIARAGIVSDWKQPPDDQTPAMSGVFGFIGSFALFGSLAQSDQNSARKTQVAIKVEESLHVVDK